VPVIVHLSDVHFGAHRPELAESLLADVRDIGPDVVVVSGDLTQRGRTSQFAEARAFVDALPPPVLTVVGNHDVPLFDLPRRLASPTGRYRKYVTSNLDPVVQVAGLTVVGLDTMPAWRWKAGHVSSRQADLVRDVLGGVPTGVWRVLATHHPVLPADLSALVGRRRLIDACEQAGVAVLLSGHTHKASVDVVTLGRGGDGRSALAVGAGTAVSSRTRRTANSYTTVHLDGPMKVGTTITVRRREPDGSGWTPTQEAHFTCGTRGVVALPFRPMPR
jgi:3',5'-cyclic AMP phosphodiesterase CpdA